MKAQMNQPSHIEDPQLAYLKFFALAMDSSIRELRSNLDNRVLAVEILTAVQLLTDNLRRRFGFPLPPLDQPIASVRPERPSLQLRTETTGVAHAKSI